MHRLCHILLFLLPIISVGQNLVPNPSFEELSGCPQSADEVELAINWYQANNSNPDIFSSCALSGYIGVPENFMGFEPAFFGNSYANICTYYMQVSQSYREYIGVKLTQPLSASTKYFVSFAISLSDSSNYSTDAFGVHFSNDSLVDSGFEPLQVQAQADMSNTFDPANKTGWELAFTSFTATGGENYLTLGNFLSDLESGIQPLNDGGLESNSDYNSAHYYIDDVCVSTDSLTCVSIASVNGLYKNPLFSIYPNPATANLTIESRTLLAQVWVSDVAGRVVLPALRLRSGYSNIDVSGLPSGIYLVEAITEDGKRSVQKVVID